LTRGRLFKTFQPLNRFALLQSFKAGTGSKSLP
jgi:hypothetical protein